MALHGTLSDTTSRGSGVCPRRVLPLPGVLAREGTPGWRAVACCCVLLLPQVTSVVRMGLVCCVWPMTLCLLCCCAHSSSPLPPCMTKCVTACCMLPSIATSTHSHTRTRAVRRPCATHTGHALHICTGYVHTFARGVYAHSGPVSSSVCVAARGELQHGRGGKRGRGGL